MFQTYSSGERSTWIHNLHNRAGEVELLLVQPVLLLQVTLPDSVMNVREKLAKNIHEVWAKGKIEAGYAYGKVMSYSTSWLLTPETPSLLSTRFVTTP